MTPRLQTIYDAIGEGLSDKLIAAKLDISVNTVKGYTHRVYAVTGLDRWQIIRQCAERDVRLAIAKE